jgi:hypothetical protein
MATENFKQELPQFLSTRDTALLLGVLPSRLSMVLWENKIPVPKRLGRSYLWSHADIVRAARHFNITMLRPEGPAGPQGPRGLMPVSALTEATRAATAPTRGAPAPAESEQPATVGDPGL